MAVKVKKDDLITWGLAGLVAVALGYAFITSQKAGAAGKPLPQQPAGQEQHKEGGGCGCEMEPKEGEAANASANVAAATQQETGSNLQIPTPSTTPI